MDPDLDTTPREDPDPLPGLEALPPGPSPDPVTGVSERMRSARLWDWPNLP